MSQKKNELPSLRKTPLDFLSRDEARQAVKAKVRDIIARGGATPAATLVKRLNAALAGWVNYFRVGNSSRAFSEVHNYVEMKVRTLLDAAETATKDECRLAAME